MNRHVATVLALSFSMVPALVHADSFMTSISAGSKTAAKIGPAPYTGKVAPVGTGMSTVRNALKLMKSTQSAAIRMDAVRIVDSVAMDDANAGKQFAAGLSRLAKSGTPQDKFIRSYNLLVRSNNKSALAAVDRAAAKLPTDPSIQLGAFEANANTGNVEKARGYLATTVALAKSSSSSLVKSELKSTADYLQYSPAYQDILK